MLCPANQGRLKVQPLAWDNLVTQCSKIKCHDVQSVSKILFLIFFDAVISSVGFDIRQKDYTKASPESLDLVSRAR